AAMALRRTGHRPPMYVGSFVIAAGMAMLTLAPPAAISSYWWLAIGAFVIGLGYGTTNPAARNAGLQLAPEHSSTLAALRTMSLYMGSIVTVSVATAIIASAGHSGHAQSWFTIAVAALLFVSLPMISRIPEHHGAW
ncbi:MAG TPA: MFS transporter, partial [Nevskiaceae bacterium]